MFKKLKRYLCNPYWEFGNIFIKRCPKLMSDKYYLSIVYYKWFDKKIDWMNPKTFNEKLQWLKLYDRNPLYTTLVDKYEVKDWISHKFGKKYIIPTYGIWTSYSEIDFNPLPNKFVLKCTHDSGSVVICRDKASLNFTYAEKKLCEGLNHNFYWIGREWPYKKVKPRIICEKLLLTKENKLPNDYKLFFINGKFEFVYVSFDREMVNDRCIFDINWNRLPFVWIPEDSFRDNINTAEVACPESFSEMLRIGSEIAKIFTVVRVDFYDVDGSLYVGEITLYHGSGLDKFFPDKYDTIYGDKIILK